MKAKAFEKQFDQNVGLTASLDLSRAKHVLIESLDREASKLGVTRQSIIKVCSLSASKSQRKVNPLESKPM